MKNLESHCLVRFDRIIRSVVNKYTYDKCHSEKDDLYQEARIAALGAIRSFNKGKKSKLSTHIVNCVRNRLIDINRSNNYYKRSNEGLDAYSEHTGLCEEIYLNEDYYERSVIKTSLEKYMNSSELSMVMSVVDKNMTITDIVEQFKESYNDRAECKREVRKCLYLAHQVLWSDENNRKSTTSTRRTKSSSAGTI